MKAAALKIFKFFSVVPAVFSGFLLISVSGPWLGGREETAFYAGVIISTAAVFFWVKWMTGNPMKKQIRELNEFVSAQETIHQFITGVDWEQKNLIFSEEHLPWSKEKIKKSIMLYAGHLKRKGHLDSDKFDLCRSTYGSLAFFVCERNFGKDAAGVLAAIPLEKERLEREFERTLGTVRSEE